MSKEFSMEESENLIANFQSGDTPISNFLTELSDVSKIKLPPLPSFDSQPSNIRSFFSARKGATVVAIEVAILATAVASAAALSGFGPEPVVNFVKAAATQVKDVVKSVSTFIAEDEAAPNPDQQIPDPQPTAAAPVATETPSAQPNTSSQPAPQSTPKPAAVAPSAKADPKPAAPGIGVAAPTKKASDDDDGNEGEEEDDDDDNKSPTPKATSTKPGTSLKSPKPMASPTKKSSDDDDDDEEDDDD